MDNNIFELDFTSQEVNSLLNKTNDINYTSEQINTLLNKTDELNIEYSSEQINTLLDKIDNFNTKEVSEQKNVYVTIPDNTDEIWTQHEDGYFYIDIKVPGIKETDIPVIDIIPSLENHESELEQWAKIIKITTNNNYITVYANELFERNITILMKVLKTFYTAGDLSDSINASYENTYDVVNRLVQQEILSYYTTVIHSLGPDGLDSYHQTVNNINQIQYLAWNNNTIQDRDEESPFNIGDDLTVTRNQDDTYDYEFNKNGYVIISYGNIDETSISLIKTKNVFTLLHISAGDIIHAPYNSPDTNTNPNTFISFYSIN